MKSCLHCTNGYYWIKYKHPDRIKIGLFLVDWGYNSLGDIEAKRIDDFSTIIRKSWIIEVVEVKNPFGDTI